MKRKKKTKKQLKEKEKLKTPEFQKRVNIEENKVSNYFTVRAISRIKIAVHFEPLAIHSQNRKELVLIWTVTFYDIPVIWKQKKIIYFFSYRTLIIKNCICFIQSHVGNCARL